jgi:calcineurin-like phosphoesterase family protein
LDNNKTIWLTSDTHYSQKNICRGTTNWRTPEGEIPTERTRNFNTLEEMNDAIVNNINNLVKEDDILIHLGDWSFGGFENIEEFRNRIICKNIHLILGNHDHHIDKNHNNIRKIIPIRKLVRTIRIQRRNHRMYALPFGNMEQPP